MLILLLLVIPSINFDFVVIEKIASTFLFFCLDDEIGYCNNSSIPLPVSMLHHGLWNKKVMLSVTKHHHFCSCGYFAATQSFSK